ncbi:mucin 13, cell surface associated [Seminavis robusta]|uniref:Mucin 13, cell surface associated n=1 Tax=Seminavis robusta TaxID=568900 RepID=A0A9N8D5M4_9STRA|nr:mucin 13, cell surface associated [Seminavis robusta]|eukprot:Sro10_g008130.1 mucin 13, cell surface associated (740) ;mRNA; r:130128-132424
MKITTPSSALWLLVSAALLSCTRSAALSSNYEPLVFSSSELIKEENLPRLAEALTTTGLVAITTTATTTATTTKQVALNGLCGCQNKIKDEKSFHELKGADTVLLGDGQTVRSTLATATVGFSPLPLDTPELAAQCGEDTVQAMETLRDQVAQTATVFLSAVDNLLLQAKRQELYTSSYQKPLIKTSYGVTYNSISSIVKAATNLEHFHVYSKNSSSLLSENHSQHEPALQVHSDAGLFLAFVPAHSCNSDMATGADQSFLIKDPADGQLKPVAFPPNSIAIMLGAGAEQWLNTPDTLPLKATRHAVHMQAGQSRAWYGMMHLVPESAIVEQTASGQARTFGDMRQAMVLKGQTKTSRTFGDISSNSAGDVSIGCGFSSDDTPAGTHQDFLSTATTTTTTPRRRLQHVENAAACNNKTEFYCWMSCLDIPNADNANGYISEKYGLYCLDPAVLAATGQVSKAVETCTEGGTVGGAMNTACVGMWQPQAPNVPSQEVVVEANSNQTESDEPWCYGGTSMYMDGFNWVGSTCAIYLFPSIILETPGALVLACFFTILFGMSLEFVIQQRRVTVRKYGPGMSRLAVSATFYGLQLTMGYAIMLVVMIYSIPLFLSVVVGIVGGHVVFSAPDALIQTSTKKGSGHRTERMHVDYKRSERKEASTRMYMSEASQRACNTMAEPTGDGSCTFHSAVDHKEFEYTSTVRSSPCTQPTNSSPGPSSDVSCFDDEVPEGSTPCCQNEL